MELVIVWLPFCILQGTLYIRLLDEQSSLIFVTGLKCPNSSEYQRYHLYMVHHTAFISVYCHQQHHCTFTHTCWLELGFVGVLLG